MLSVVASIDEGVKSWPPPWTRVFVGSSMSALAPTFAQFICSAAER
jgi:hypothetical protein